MADVWSGLCGVCWKHIDGMGKLDIDSDLCSSAWDALDWAFKYKVATPGTVIGYDDFWVLPSANDHAQVDRYGEAKAHKQISNKYQVSFQCICGPCIPHEEGKPWGWRTYFVVQSIGAASNGGFTMTNADSKAYMAGSGVCRQVKQRNHVKI